MKNIRDIIKPEELTFLLYFDNKFVGYECWTERGWMYSQDGKTWNFKPKYAYTCKIIYEKDNS